jgi:tetratricopeptide (TPR) repeat protein
MQETFKSAVAYHQAGQLDQAERLYNKILISQPRQPDVLHMLGLICFQRQQIDKAIELIRRAINLNPKAASYHCNLAQVFVVAQRLDEAIFSANAALALRPDYPESHNNLGNALQAKGQAEQAIVAYRRAVAQRSTFAEAWHNLGVALQLQGNFAEGLAAEQKALQHRPAYPEALVGLGKALKNLGRAEEAFDAYRRALELSPEYFEAMHNMASCLVDLRRIPEAIELHRRAIAMRPESPEAHFCLGTALLTRGDFAQGWPEYEWRARLTLDGALFRRASTPIWNGQSLNGERILIHSEQGFGDILQFVRYIPLVQRLGGCVILTSPRATHRLLLNSFPNVTVVQQDDVPPTHDIQCPMLSLPRLLQTSMESIPKDLPYLRAAAPEIEFWRKRVSALPGRKIGIVWAGRREPDPRRSAKLLDLSELLRLSNTSFVSLQVGEGAEQLRDSSLPSPIIDWTGELTDFAATAGLVECLDAIVTIDSAMAHLAGAMGKRVSVLLSYWPDWRWMMDRPDSPWYPTMRLYRQPSPRDWTTPMRQLAAHLLSFARNDGQANS